MGGTLFCNCNRRNQVAIDDNTFLSTELTDNEGIKIIVDNPKGNYLPVLCKYGVICLYKKITILYPKMANKTYLYFNNEMRKMIDFLEKNNSSLLAEKFFRIKFTGVMGFESFSNSNTLNSIEFHLVGEYKIDRQLNKIIYNYNWRQDNLFGLNTPSQKVKLVDITYESDL